MKRPLLTILLCTFAIISPTTALTAQTFVATPVEISSDKVNIKGEIFYAHKVLKGHTLYSISKAYGIAVDEIKTVNPALDQEGLKAGMIIYIPVTTGRDNQSGPVANGTKTVQNDNPPIAVKQEEPSKSVADTRPEKKNYRKYRLKWYETIQDAAVKLNVPVDAIIALNGIDTTSSKRIRTILVPDKEYITAYAASGNESDIADTNENSGQDAGGELGENITVLSIPQSGEKYDDGIYKISIILPFNASDSTTNPNSYTADFYSGALLAANRLKKEGLFDNFELNVIDLDKYGSAWELISDNVLDGSGLIIGPISERDLQPIASYAKNRRIPVVSPLDPATSALLEGNPYLFLFPPQSDNALDRQLDKIAARTHPDSVETVTVLYEKGYRNSPLVAETEKGLKERDTYYRMFEYGFMQGRGIDTIIARRLDPVHLNKVIIPSLDEAFVSDALRNLNLVESEGRHRICVYGMSKWKGYETLEPAYLHSLDLRLSLSYHTDYNNQEAKDFIASYKAAFNTVPSSFAFQGYDIVDFFLRAMNEYGKDFPAHIMNKRKSLLQSDVLFLPVSYGSGYENRALKDICYTRDWVIRSE